MRNYLSAVELGYRLPDGRLLFDNLNFSFSAVRSGLVGVNGIGKTTLLEILAGKREPSAGAVNRHGRVSYLPQQARFGPSATVAEAVALADRIAALERVEIGEGTSDDFDLIADRWDLRERIDQAFSKIGASHIAIDRPMESLSGGEAARVRIAGLLLEEPDFLILDEPTNHLDLSARESVYDMVASWKRGLIVVSHDRRLLAILDQIAELNANGLKFYGGDYEFYRRQREVERKAAEETLQSSRQRLKDAKMTAQRAAERQQRRQSHGRKNSHNLNLPPIIAGGLSRAAENTAARLKDMHQRKVDYAKREVEEARQDLPLELQIAVDLERSKVPPNKRMIELVEVNYSSPGAGRPLWARPLSFEVIGPERVWLKGANGAGKSTLIDLIRGWKIPVEGTVRAGAERIGFLDQTVSALDDSLTVLENLRRAAPSRPESDLRTLLGRFLFIRDAALKPASVLSGGERMRAGLACLLGADQSPEILILDEATNNLDLPSVEELASALRGFGGAMIVVSHDSTFIEEIGVERAIDLDHYCLAQSTALDYPRQ
ncbi:MAG TPA: ABC-F family ATP-binding cassette domain-containing protein [Blastocatellia bacterium]|jgi:ATPase subunit of ABC transporter with duplicated ATPase domains